MATSDVQEWTISQSYAPIPSLFDYDAEAYQREYAQAMEQMRLHREVARLRDTFDLAPAQRVTAGDFAQIMTVQQDRFGHVPFCGARAHYVLDESYTPVMVDGYSAARWRSMFEERLQLAMTEWGPGFNVVTSFDPYAGHFYTIVRAGDLEVDRRSTLYDNAKDALQGHKEAVMMAMKLRRWHSLDPQPIQDKQVLLDAVPA